MCWNIPLGKRISPVHSLNIELVPQGWQKEGIEFILISNFFGLAHNHDVYPESAVPNMPLIPSPTLSSSLLSLLWTLETLCILVLQVDKVHHIIYTLCLSFTVFASSQYIELQSTNTQRRCSFLLFPETVKLYYLQIQIHWWVAPWDMQPFYFQRGQRRNILISVAWRHSDAGVSTVLSRSSRRFWVQFSGCSYVEISCSSCARVGSLVSMHTSLIRDSKLALGVNGLVIDWWRFTGCTTPLPFVGRELGQYGL